MDEYFKAEDIDLLLSKPIDLLNRRALTNLKDSMGSSSRRLQTNEVLATIGDAWRLDPSRIVGSYGTAGEKTGAPSSRLKDQPVLTLDVSHALITQYSTIVVDGQLLMADLGLALKSWRTRGFPRRLQDAFGIVAYDPDEGKCILSHATPERLDDPRGYFLFQSRAAFHQFGHFVHDIMLQIAFYEECCAFAGTRLIPLIANSSIRFNGQPFANQLIQTLFETLVADEATIAYLNGRSVIAERCYTSTTAFRTDAFTVSKYGADHIRATLARADLPKMSVPGVGRKVWISRRDGKASQDPAHNVELDNEHLLGDIAEACGFSVVNLAKFQPEEVFGILDSAEIIAGVHGDGLLGTVLCPSGKTLIECKLAPWTYETPWLMAEAFGLDVQHVPTIPSVIGKGRSVDLAQLFGALRGA